MEGNLTSSLLHNPNILPLSSFTSTSTFSHDLCLLSSEIQTFESFHLFTTTHSKISSTW